MTKRKLKSSKELDNKQKEDLIKFYKSVDNDVNITNQILKQDVFKLLHLNFIKVIVLLVFITSSILIIIGLNKNKHDSNIVTTYKIEEYTGNVISVSMNKDDYSLNYNVRNISIETVNNNLNIGNIVWLKRDMLLKDNDYIIENTKYTISKDIKLSSMDISKDMVYLQYKNKEGTASKELIFSSTKPSIIDVSTIRNNNGRYYEYNGYLENKVYTYSYDNSFIMLIEKISGGELENNSLINEITDIEYKATKSTLNNEFDIVINFNNIGSVHVNKINTIDNIQAVYDVDTDILRIRNNKENVDYIYIFSATNEYINLYIGDFVKTNDKQVYLHKDFFNENSNGYNTILLRDNDNLYCVKFNDKDNVDTCKEFLKQLNKNFDNLEFTVDN